MILTGTSSSHQEVNLYQNISSPKTPSCISLATQGPGLRTDLTWRDQWFFWRPRQTVILLQVKRKQKWMALGRVRKTMPTPLLHRHGLCFSILSELLPSKAVENNKSKWHLIMDQNESAGIFQEEIFILLYVMLLFSQAAFKIFFLSSLDFLDLRGFNFH